MMRVAMGVPFGRYVLESKLAAGGMAEVFLATQAGPGGFGRRCVLKRMHPGLAADSEFVEMFLSEARVTAQLSHPNIAQVYDFGEVDGAYFLALEWVDGPSLHAVLRHHREAQTRLPTGAVLRIGSEIALGLDHAHNARAPDGRPLNLIHRDISPSNVLISRSGQVKVIDFGIAKTALLGTHTATGMVKGKLPYMSPEQSAAQPLDRRSDVYAVGLVLYEMLILRRAVQGGTEAELFHAAQTGRFSPVEVAWPECPSVIARIVGAALARDREQRTAGCAELAIQLDQAMAELSLTAADRDLAALAQPVADPPTFHAAPSIQSEGTPASTWAAGSGATPVTRADHPATPSVQLASVTIGLRRPSQWWWTLALASLLVAGALGASAAWKRSLPLPDRPSTQATAEPSETHRGDAEPPKPAPTPETPLAIENGREGGDSGRPPHAAMEPVARPGKLAITSTPSLKVSVDGKRRGVTPVTVDVPAGEHRVLFEAPGVSRELAVRVRAGKSERLILILDKAWLTVRAYPTASVFVDGRSLGETPVEMAPTFAGEHTVKLVNEAEGWEQSVTVLLKAEESVMLKAKVGGAISVVRGASK